MMNRFQVLLSISTCAAYILFITNDTLPATRDFTLLSIFYMAGTLIGTRHKTSSVCLTKCLCVLFSDLSTCDFTLLSIFYMAGALIGTRDKTYIRRRRCV